jgi:molybdate transport system substrate-binding protein
MIRGSLPIGLVALAFAGCGGDVESAGELTVSAASSLTEAFQSYDTDFAGDTRYSFAGSDELAAQIRSGAPADVFASANTSLPDELHADGLVEEPVQFARNELVLATPAGSEIDALGDLAEPGIDLVIGAEGVPVGDYTRAVLAQLGGALRGTIYDAVRSEEPDVKGIVGKLVVGAADAGFVYATDVKAAGDRLRSVALPPILEPEVAYGIAVVSDSDDVELADEFITGLLEGPGAEDLADAGFLPPAGGP